MRIIEELREKLFAAQDLEYRDFHQKLIPGSNADYVIGVRTPILRLLAKEYKEHPEIHTFFDNLPHKYFEENQLHSFILGLEKDYDKCMTRIQEFLPYVDNWATCDQLSPKVFKKHLRELENEIRRWIVSEHTYTIRFAIEMLMSHFLDEHFSVKYADMVADVRSEEYYVNMMIAWYFATALAKQYDSILPYIQQKKLEDWTHNKTIQKAIESYRITDEQKTYLRTLKVKNTKNSR